MEDWLYKLDLNQRKNLPDDSLLQALTTVVDQLDLCVLLVDCNGKICYFNNCYLNTYAEIFEKSGVSVSDIIGMDVRRGNDARGGRVIKALNSGKPYVGEYFNDPDTGEFGYANMIPFQTESFHGVAVIQQKNSSIRKVTKEILYYRDLTRQLQQRLETRDNLPDSFQNIIGQSPIFIQAMKTAARVAASGSSVCLLGESGTGKEVFAEAIHYASPCANGPLVKINCAAIPESLLESELFGYEKGSFTGANAKGKPGKFELANNGTLFLDEIGELPLPMQSKLLRALQEKTIVRIGGTRPVKLNFRLITATNRDLEQMIQEGTFREDLFYRICIIPITLPPLRERPSDIPLLANHFLQLLPLPNIEKLYFSAEVLEQFQQYSWPGNIRELRNTVERMAVLSGQDEITLEYLPKKLGADVSESEKKEQLSLNEAEDQLNLHKLTAKLEMETIQKVLQLTGGNKAQAIKILGISKRTFYMKLEKYGIE